MPQRNGADSAGICPNKVLVCVFRAGDENVLMQAIRGGITLTLETATVPDPSTYVLMASGLAAALAALGAGVIRRRRRSL